MTCSSIAPLVSVVVEVHQLLLKLFKSMSIYNGLLWKSQLSYHFMFLGIKLTNCLDLF